MKDAEYFKILLSQRLDELLTEAKKTAGGRTLPQDEAPDFTDEASIESERDLVFRIKERQSGLIRKIKDALMRLKDGTFGICEECGEEISEIGNHLPRRCGIATFTTDLLEALSIEAPETDCWAVVMNDVPEGYFYPTQVCFELNHKDLAEMMMA